MYIENQKLKSVALENLALTLNLALSNIYIPEITLGEKA